MHRRWLLLPTHNNFLIELLGYYPLVGKRELVAISGTGKMWNGEGYEVEDTLNGPHSLGAVIDGARIDVGMQR